MEQAVPKKVLLADLVPASNRSLRFLGPAAFVPEEPLSPETLSRVSTWMRECLESHETCKTESHSFLPKRLLDLAPSERQDALILRETAELACHVAYATLSHPWGRSRPIVTTRMTLQDHMRGISGSAMPQTFLDAITVVRTLGLRYLWIDSLCIVQDDKLDWQQESSRMASIYGASYVTVSALCATDTASGFLIPRKELSLTYLHYDGRSFPVTARENCRTSVGVTLCSNEHGTFRNGCLLRESCILLPLSLFLNVAK